MQKLEKKNKFKLDLHIESFSPFPSGSYYRSKDVNFIGVNFK